MAAYIPEILINGRSSVHARHFVNTESANKNENNRFLFLMVVSWLRMRSELVGALRLSESRFRMHHFFWSGGFRPAVLPQVFALGW
jgi:hypothetical protein